jgi:outer membrane protein assembly factor BamE
MPETLMRPLLLACCAALMVAGCGVVYRQPIYQGNLLESSAVEQLQAGMSKQQVQGLLGTPSIQDPFHHDRWDYTSTQRTDRFGNTEVKNFTLWFEDGALTRWEGEYFPEQDQQIADSAIRQFGPNLAKDDDDKRGR